MAGKLLRELARELQRRGNRPQGRSRTGRRGTRKTSGKARTGRGTSARKR